MHLFFHYAGIGSRVPRARARAGVLASWECVAVSAAGSDRRAVRVSVSVAVRVTARVTVRVAYAWCHSIGIGEVHIRARPKEIRAGVAIFENFADPNCVCNFGGKRRDLPIRSRCGEKSDLSSGFLRRAFANQNSKSIFLPNQDDLGARFCFIR